MDVIQDDFSLPAEVDAQTGAEIVSLGKTQALQLLVSLDSC